MLLLLLVIIIWNSCWGEYEASLMIMEILDEGERVREKEVKTEIVGKCASASEGVSLRLFSC